ncbi:MAG: hypothetical protein N2045_03580 [Fimbriimonadales bacterium]|nr:hypothetical protein [Fimbriimonadales bacterium]
MSDTDIDCGQPNEIWHKHGDGTNILWLDGHVKWQKPSFRGNPSLPENWTFPPYCPGGDDEPIGPWAPWGWR